MGTADTKCLNDREVQDYLDQKATLPERMAVEKHIKECRNCMTTYERFSRVNDALNNGLMPDANDIPAKASIDRVMEKIANVEATESPFSQFLKGVILPYLVPLGAMALLFALVFPYRPAPTPIESEKNSGNVVPDSPKTFVYLSFMPKGTGLKCLENPEILLPNKGFLEKDKNYVIPPMGKVVVGDGDGNEIEFSRQALFALSPSEVKISQGQVSCLIRSIPAGGSFAVHSPHGRIICIGTQFTVEAEKDTTRLTLKKGIVKVKTSKNEKTIDYPGIFVLNSVGEISRIIDSQPGSTNTGVDPPPIETVETSSTTSNSATSLDNSF